MKDYSYYQKYYTEQQYQKFINQNVKCKLLKNITTIDESLPEEEKKAISKVKTKTVDDYDISITRVEFDYLFKHKLVELLVTFEREFNKQCSLENTCAKNEISRVDNKFFYMEFNYWIARLPKVERPSKERYLASMNLFYQKRLANILRYAGAATEDKTVDELLNKMTIEEKIIFNEMLELVKNYKEFIQNKN